MVIVAVRRPRFNNNTVNGSMSWHSEHPRYGYRRIAALLRQEGWHVGKRHIQRLRRDEGLRVPPTKRKVIRRGVSTGLPTTATHRNHVWTCRTSSRCYCAGQGVADTDDPRTNTRVSVMC